jgi:hypothetical protein
MVDIVQNHQSIVTLTLQDEENSDVQLYYALRLTVRAVWIALQFSSQDIV